MSPLRISTHIGFATGLFGVAVATWAILSKLVFQDTVPGWTAVVVLISIVSAVQFLLIGIVGEYVGRVYEQVKRRPIYIVADVVNTGHKPEAPSESWE